MGSATTPSALRPLKLESWTCRVVGASTYVPERMNSSRSSVAPLYGASDAMPTLLSVPNAIDAGSSSFVLVITVASALAPAVMAPAGMHAKFPKSGLPAPPFAIIKSPFVSNSISCGLSTSPLAVGVSVDGL